MNQANALFQPVSSVKPVKTNFALTLYSIISMTIQKTKNIRTWSIPVNSEIAVAIPWASCECACTDETQRTPQKSGQADNAGS